MIVHLKPLDGSASLVIDKPITLVGRHPDCDYVVTDRSKISRKHCCVALVDSRVIIRDLDSMNGVWVNGDRVEHSQELRVGDSLKIGSVPFQVVGIDAPAGSEPVAASADSLDLESTLDALGQQPGSTATRRRDDTRVVGDDGESVDIHEISGGEKIEFSSAVAMPTDSQDGDVVIPPGDVDE